MTRPGVCRRHKPVTGVGTRLSLVDPLPSWLSVFQPQHWAGPARSVPHAAAATTAQPSVSPRGGIQADFVVGDGTELARQRDREYMGARKRPPAIEDGYLLLSHPARAR
jgi:hypothetical protein